MGYRKIIFRGKDPRNGEWVYGGYIPSDFSNWTTDTIFDGNNRKEIELHTLGQYTGMYDIENQPIYEDDIISFPHRRKMEIGVVSYDDGRFYIRNRVQLHSDNLCSVVWTKKVRIIGNVFDNPELLEEKEMGNTKLESCPFEEPNGAYEIKKAKKKKTWFELVTASPSSLAYFCRDIRCDCGHHNFDEYPPCSEPEEMVKWLMQETDKEVY